MNQSIFKRVFDPPLRRLLQHAGYSVRRHPQRPVDLRSVTDNPVAAKYLVNCSPVLLNIPINRCRGFETLNFQLAPNMNHPFVLTACALMKNIKLNYSESPLRIYYELFQPKNASEVLSIPKKNCKNFQKIKPLEAVEPWDRVDSLIRKNIRIEFIKKENKKMQKSIDANHGIQFWGSVSNEKGEVEIARLRALLLSIKKNGYQRHEKPDGDIVGSIIVSGSRWAVRTYNGQHRAAVLAALGYDRIPIRIMLNETIGMVHREDFQQWPHVRDQLYTPEQALSVFDNMLEGNPPDGAKEAANRAAKWYHNKKL
ncbi:hypothetical protein SAMN05421693_10243 [Ectothiorhodospira magna]|uniref:Uncharacterized protein n=1 Tax=Ectothiorhodospira magna TaxID=867345 RepID=A0A1H8ZAN4_9GAMM|nr:hypothetical protein [Ectothiorhodospira magna]SEP61413.1 hypothetical protein SAMN05421693_10243 [Ectothiorhodospira magna]